MRNFVGLTLMAVATGLGCGGSSSSSFTTVKLKAALDGNLQYCDSAGACQELPNPKACATLTADITTSNAQVCETCLDASGATISNSCSGTHITCTVSTSTEPHCLACSYDGSTIVFTSCTPTPPANCNPFTPLLLASSAPTCDVCVDATGSTTVVNQCPVDCSNVICPMIACAEGSTMTRPLQGCCPICEPITPCQGVACLLAEAIPACPPGSITTRNPLDCCGYVCEPVACPPTTYATTPACPEGFVWDTTFPSCGKCAPVPNPIAVCLTSADCPAGDTCTTDITATAQPCLPPPPATGGTTTGSPIAISSSPVASACYGVCKPKINICAMPMVIPSCTGGGVAKSPGFDANGCPLPPVCVCADGTIAVDNTCTVCALGLECPVPACGSGTHLDQSYPHCCGICVPDVTYCASDSYCLATQTCVKGVACVACGPTTLACPPTAGAATNPVAPCLGTCQPI